MSLGLLIPLSLVMGLVGLAAFFWAMRNHQFEDLEGAAWRVIMSANDDDVPATNPVAGAENDYGNAETQRVEWAEDQCVVDAALLAQAFGLPVGVVQQEMQNGSITSRTERGTEEDEGKFRLTFFHLDRAFRLTVDADGHILSRTRFPAPNH